MSSRVATARPQGTGTRRRSPGARCPGARVVRPVPSVITPTSNGQREQHQLLRRRARARAACPARSRRAATAGIVRPMLASAEPSARLRLVCRRLRARRPQRRQRLGQQHQRGDDDADHRLRRAEPRRRRPRPSATAPSRARRPPPATTSSRPSAEPGARRWTAAARAPPRRRSSGGRK